MEPLRFGLIGCGRIATRHAKVISEMTGAELAAVCDVRPERAEAVGKKYSVPWYTSHRQMLAEASMDVVNVLTPSGDHAQPAIDAARAGRHVVVEKPMALTLDDADEMIRVCAEHNVRLFVVKQNRYNLAVQKLREARDRGRFGKMVLGTARVRWCRTQEYYDQDDWRGTWAKDGGVLANQASHHIDLLEWMMGDVASVMAMTATRLVKIETEDTAVAILRFRSGALGVIEATTATRPRDLEGAISILGEQGTVEIAGFAVNEIRTWQFSRPEPEDAEVVRTSAQRPPDQYGFGHARFLANVVECIREGRPALVDGLEGRRSLELILAIYESVETGQEIELRFQPKLCRLGLA
ncbi:MAG: Gfo/Idh/MocA family oxidoreductase [Candidatus Riflebacteria bacterium]|nr:Gfo/Idh/MocA family oxidoreductase [Candidatus Riflebacteria bacterium]